MTFPGTPDHASHDRSPPFPGTFRLARHPGGLLFLQRLSGPPSGAGWRQRGSRSASRDTPLKSDDPYGVGEPGELVLVVNLGKIRW